MSKTILEIKKFDGNQDLTAEVDYFGFDKVNVVSNRAELPKEIIIRIPMGKIANFNGFYGLWIKGKVKVFPEVVIKVISSGKNLVYTLYQADVDNINVTGDANRNYWEIKFIYEKLEYKFDAAADANYKY